MALYRSHIALLCGTQPVSQATIDHRAIKHLSLFTRGAAAQSLNLILASALEWRPETQLAALRAQGVRIVVAPPTSWAEWVTAFTTLFAPANRIALLARDVMTLQAKTGESVDVFSLRVTQAYSRLIEEAKRTAPPNVSPHEHAFEQAKIASFENGLPPDIRLELVREDASDSFAKSKARARKHETNKIRNPTATISALSQPAPAQLEQKIEDAVSRLSGMEQYLSGDSGFRASSVAYTRPDNRTRAPQQNGKRSYVANPNQDGQPHHNKRKVAAKSTNNNGNARGGGNKTSKSSGKRGGGGGNDGGATDGTSNSVECDYVGCRGHDRRFSHARADCRIEANHKAQGLKLVNA